MQKRSNKRKATKRSNKSKSSKRSNKRKSTKSSNKRKSSKRNNKRKSTKSSNKRKSSKRSNKSKSTKHKSSKPSQSCQYFLSLYNPETGKLGKKYEDVSYFGDKFREGEKIPSYEQWKKSHKKLSKSSMYFQERYNPETGRLKQKYWEY